MHFCKVLLGRIALCMRQHQAFHFTVMLRHIYLPYRQGDRLLIQIVVKCHNHLLVLRESSIRKYVMSLLQEFQGAMCQHRTCFVDTDHFFVECDQVVIFLAPRIGPAVVRIGKSTDSGLIAVIDRRCSRPGHLHHNGLTHDRHVDILGEISYLTQALVAILQLGVTMDYSIFLLDSFEENKKRFPGDKNRAMGHAISNTFKSIVSSSITTVAGFAALCLMTFALGKNLGIVMAKGVIIGVICCVTLLPAIILIFDPLIEKTKHKPLIKNTNRLSGFIIRHYKIWLAVFCIGLLPAVYGNNHTKIYYNIDKSLPSTLDSNVANKKLEDTFDMSTMHIIMMDKNISNANRTTLMKDIEKVDGVKWAFGLNSVFGANVPASMIPKDVKDMLQSDEQELVFVCLKYSSATDESNSQIAAINDLVKKYDSNGMVIGEAPLMKDLQDVTDIDLVNVNVASVAAIFIIIMLVFKSISVPIILVAVIEFAINVNMAIPFFQGIELPFVASIVVGTIQLGATVDYAILMTSRYQKERRKGFGKKEAVMNAHKACALSIMTSGFSFFAATFGVAWYSKVDMIGAICTLLSRGALISMACVIFILPAMFIIFDKVICKTSIDFLGEKAKAKAAARA